MSKTRKVLERKVVLFFILGVCLLPLVWTMLAALGLQPDGRGWRGSFTMDNFSEVGIFEPAFGVEFGYTLAVVIIATGLTIGCAFPAAYQLAQVQRKWAGWLMQGLLVLAVVPVIGYGLPLSDLMRKAGLYGTYPGLVLVYASTQLPLALWVLRGYLVRVPRSLEEAAWLEGASWWRVVWGLMLPVVAGGVAATAVLVFVLDWNSFLLPGLLMEKSPLVLPMAMRDFFAFERDLEWPTAAAVLLVSLLPAFILILASQRALDKFNLIPQELPL